jgi:DNA-directed RNA polymerase specialized sigma24 family protein
MAGLHPPIRPIQGREPDAGDGSSAVAPAEEFSTFVQEHEPRLRRTLVAAYGGQRGREATAEALAYAWEHWSRVSEMQNAPGYLFRVGQSRTRHRRVPLTFDVSDQRQPEYEPRLIPVLRSLSQRQRTAVVLVHGFGWTLREVAEMTGTKVTTVQNHVERGLAKLRAELGGGTR